MYIRSLRRTQENIPSKIFEFCKGIALCHGPGGFNKDCELQQLLHIFSAKPLSSALLGLDEHGLNFLSLIMPLFWDLKPHNLLMDRCCSQSALQNKHYGKQHTALEILSNATHYSLVVDLGFVVVDRNYVLVLVFLLIVFFILSEFGSRLLGNPNEEVWPGVGKLMKWLEFPK
ncbi:Cyclin-dependent kinase [Handroanthus impetiginosus]|uniref:Cyclin-dependent kinase n=1 Tax=Handroanthus impetiginosus TaxID=429701 RepID=A0A2G9IAM9_9LAMI|nr:Cyclin-dependent kinase [Handroanthus impetiginosus]